jgi:hypothetical protein
MNPQRMRSSHEKFPVRAPRTVAHKMRNSVAQWAARGVVKVRVVEGTRLISNKPWVAPPVEVAPKVERKWMFA